MALEETIQSNDSLRLAAFVENLLPVELARAFFRLAKGNQIRILELLGPEKSAAMISKKFEILRKEFRNISSSVL